MKKSELRKLIRKTIKENHMSPVTSKATLDEIENLRDSLCIQGDVTDVINKICDEKCPCSDDCTCAKKYSPEKDGFKQVGISELHEALVEYPNGACEEDREEYLNEIEAIKKDPIGEKPYASQCKKVAADSSGGLWLVNCGQICIKGKGCPEGCDCWG